ncbi:MAG: hypothetical protein NT157_01835 [Candidatus Micrarchaeota archaeon]|nr:hypothetical protein [Candidatus Micrarchaeota archaeon]
MGEMAAQRIIDTGVRTHYLNAFEIGKRSGGELIRHALLDELILNRRVFGIFFAKEAIFTNPPGTTLRPGDTLTDFHNRQIVPPDFLRELDEKERSLGRGAIFGKEKIGLFVEPAEINDSGQPRVIRPASITTITNIEIAGGGRADEATKMPVEVSKDVFRALPEHQKRWFLAGAGGLQFISRGHDPPHYNPREIEAVSDSGRFEVLISDSSMALGEIQALAIGLGCEVLRPPAVIS